MINARSLHLYEQILLLELDEEKGTTGQDTWAKTEMGGAILAELAMAGVITISDDKKMLVHPATGAPSATAAATAATTAALHGDPILSEALARITSARRAAKASAWVQKFAGIKDLKNTAARQLVAKGVLHEEQGKVLGIFKRTIFPEANPGPEQELRRRLEEAIFTETSEVEAATIVIIALGHATGLLKKIFPQKRLKARSRRIEALVRGNVAGHATREAVEAIQAAIMVSTIIPAVMVSTAAATH